MYAAKIMPIVFRVQTITIIRIKNDMIICKKATPLLKTQVIAKYPRKSTLPHRRAFRVTQSASVFPQYHL